MPKGNWEWSDKAKCPFFSSESANHHRINCNEGPQLQTAISISFSGKDCIRQNYMRYYCCSNYAECEIFRICAAKWD